MINILFKKMNIFFLSSIARNCARYHVDKHVIKMILEACQLLYTCLWIHNPKCLKNAPLTKSGSRGYKKSHENHPSAKWVRESNGNYQWLCELGIELCDEYEYRFDKVHASREHLEWLIKQDSGIEKQKCTKMIQVVPEKYIDDFPIRAYRAYYMGEKNYLAKWTRRNTPHWYEQIEG